MCAHAFRRAPTLKPRNHWASTPKPAPECPPTAELGMLSSYAQPRLLVWNDSGRVAGDGRRRSQVPGFGPNQQSWAVPRGALRLLDCTEAVAQSREKVTVPVMVGRTGHYHLNSSPCPNRSAVCGVINKCYPTDQLMYRVMDRVVRQPPPKGAASGGGAGRSFRGRSSREREPSAAPITFLSTNVTV